jgi:hypothetical protein
MVTKITDYENHQTISFSLLVLVLIWDFAPLPGQLIASLVAWATLSYWKGNL